VQPLWKAIWRFLRKLKTELLYDPGIPLLAIYPYYKIIARCRGLKPIILATQEAEIRRISVRSQPGQIVHKTLSQKNLSQKRTGGVAQGVDPEFKPQHHKK
jgi:hypothetical protein